jgi:hypothetical protein
MGRPNTKLHVDAAKLYIEHTKEELREADNRHGYATNLLVRAQRAKRRVDEDFPVLLAARYGRMWDDVEVCDYFARVAYSAIYWQVKANPNLTADERLRDAYDSTVEMLHGMSERMRRRLWDWDAPWYSNKQVADMLGVSWEERQLLGLRQVRACDLTDEEFVEALAKVNNEKERLRIAAKRRAEGVPTVAERKANDAARKAALERAAEEHEVSVGTIRAWIKAGKIADPRPSKSRVGGSNSPICIDPTPFFDPTDEARDGGRVCARPPSTPMAFGVSGIDGLNSIETAKNGPNRASGGVGLDAAKLLRRAADRLMEGLREQQAGRVA